ncbi:macrophage migration inhibitory factor-like protein [Fimicolochytrium jonesii]|uniref:macrophage migration inhibitory factor-like protein n=1 Tax=Fimicolochytrium jonesii TaxID=1396493 RepID=UPI0022FEA3AC|nr:macrophage migration inhibitory factor-like protein [Fimicolochytrium jonesii]KAI8816631.1 macrophage migration inhibitory factor-like protein [Fimicolochytrium jonesii]
MPFLTIQTNTTATDREALVSALSALGVKLLSKPEKYMVVNINENATLAFGGSQEPAAIVEVKSIGGLTKENNKEISAQIQPLLEKHLKVPAYRYYIFFSHFDAEDVGYAGATFATL